MMTIDPFEYEKYKKYFFTNYIAVISNQDLLFSDEIYNKYKVHHYTNINGLEGILKEGEFWVSQADFLNDKTEMKYTFDMSKEIFSSICKEKKKSQDEINTFSHLFDEAVNRNKENGTNYYTLSFSRNPDSNLLWSNYSQDDGYSITFKFKELFDGLTQDRNSGGPLPIASKVIYEKSEQKSKLLKLLSEIIDRFEDKTNKGNYDVNSDGFIINAITVLEWYSIFFKDECFSQEEEFRIAFLYLRNSDAKIYDCRISNGTFIPYVKIKIDCNSVKGVTIGPKNNMDINKEGLRKFLWKHEYDLTKVNISKSKIPYRY
ncbi:hypothetical protein COM17_08395 [Bacillus altitudinis]|nr:hypothetical protein COM17_08395 [Bacillus altitudinis]